MEVLVAGIVARRPSHADDDGEQIGEFPSLRDAMMAVGDSCDKGENKQVVCFYFYQDGKLVWTLTPNMR